ncbi:MAG TPA: hypothetical protein VK116_18435, partial [Planctomycetota bacterium]|nr:hypothetical protein [Planctomycetota bacterium]
DAAKVIGARNARALKRELRDLASDVKAPPAAAGRSMRWLARLRSQLETTGPARALRRSE